MRLISGLAALVLSGSMAFAVDGGRVWVAPFSEANDSGGTPAQAQNPDWISRALRQSVVDDLAALKGVSVTNTTATTAAANAPTTHPSDVDYVVSGTIQRVNGELRVSGRIEDVAGNRTVGGFKATGSEKELFAIEDSIASQLKSTLAPASSAPATSKPAGGYAGAEPGGAFEGSDLQRALADRDYLRRLQMAGEPAPEYGYTQPVDSSYSTYPGYHAVYSPFLLGGPGYVYYPNYNYSPYGGYGYGGYPYGYGWGGGSSNIVIINGSNGGHGHHGGSGHGGGGGSPAPTPRPNVQAAQMQAIRNASSFAGNPPPGVVTTMTHEPVNTMTSVPANTMTGPQLVPGGATPGRR